MRRCVVIQFRIQLDPTESKAFIAADCTLVAQDGAYADAFRCHKPV
jgi:hypothetical protein